MQASLADLAALIGGHLIGEGTVLVTGAATLNDAGPGAITLLDSAEKLKRLDQTAAAAAIVPQGVESCVMPVIQADDVHVAFATVVQMFRPRREAGRIGLSPAAHIRPTAQLADDVDVYPGAYIGDDVTIGAGATIHPGACVMAGCRLGERVTVYPNAVLYEGTIVGPRVVIHANAVIGADGFGYSLVDGRHELGAQLGHVDIGADADIGAGTTIDRGTYGPTTIGEGTKIDDQVMIGHNCRIGRFNMLCSQVGVAGSVTTGDYVVMGGQAGIRDHVRIGSRATVGAKSGAVSDIAEGVTMIGSPARPVREMKLILASLGKLPEMRKHLKQIQKELEQLETRGEHTPRAVA